MKILIYVFILTSLSAFGQQSEGQWVTDYLLPEFVPGKIVMKNGTDLELMVNYEMLSGKLVIVKNGIDIAIGKNDRHGIDSVYAGDHVFVSINNQFLEILYDSIFSLYVDHRASIDRYGRNAGYGSRSELGSIQTTSTYNSGGAVFKLDKTIEYEKDIDREYYLKIDELLKFSSKNQFLKFFPQHKKSLKKFIKKEEINFDSPKSMVKLTQYLEEIL